MKNYITYLSWEERFIKTIKHDLDNYSFEFVILLYSSEIKDKTNSNLKEFQKLLTKLDVKYIEIELFFNDEIKSWKIFNDLFLKKLENKNDFLVNISTMPRNMIYQTLHFMNQQSKNHSIIYYNAKSHDQHLTKNPSKPKLVLQHSGEIDNGKQTLLVVFLGYDVERLYQLYYYFEPSKLLICLEEEDKTEVSSRTSLEAEKKFNDIERKEIHNISSYKEENILNFLNSKITPLLDLYNVVLCSLGPKISSVDLFRYNLINPEIAIAYAQSKDYSDNYSTGVDLENPIIKRIN